jgi:uncharacterized membrane protein
MVSWLRRRFITGFFVTVPLIISVAALVWIFRVIDGITEPLVSQWVGRAVPGLGLVITGLLVLVVGVTATNMVGKRVLQRAEAGLLHIPLFRTVYAPVKQLVAAFSPDNEYGFKRVVLVQEPGRGYVLGFLTREFTLARVDGADTLLAVYIPTNHLYLGDIVIYPRERVLFPDLTVEDGVRIFLTGGMALPLHLSARYSTPGPSTAGELASTPVRDPAAGGEPPQPTGPVEQGPEARRSSGSRPR